MDKRPNRCGAGTRPPWAWLADTLAGDHALIIVDTNEQAATLSGHVQAELVRYGTVGEPVVELADGNRAAPGDLIQARRNDRRIRSAAGNWVVNRRTYRVSATAPTAPWWSAPQTAARSSAHR